MVQRQGVWIAAVFVIVLAVHVAGLGRQIEDSYLVVSVALSIVRHGTVSLRQRDLSSSSAAPNR